MDVTTPALFPTEPGYTPSLAIMSREAGCRERPIGDLPNLKKSRLEAPPTFSIRYIAIVLWEAIPSATSHNQAASQSG
jgi:hypothetical protein